jgi:hypothetical protein
MCVKYMGYIYKIRMYTYIIHVRNIQGSVRPGVYRRSCLILLNLCTNGTLVNLKFTPPDRNQYKPQGLKLSWRQP